MTGPEHYREAERLLDDADAKSHDGELEQEAVITARAQVHATLALAAATADPQGHHHAAWLEAIR